MSSHDFAIGPDWSNEDAKAIMPKRDAKPYVGLRPERPHKDAGCRMDPPVSVPVAAAHNLAATAAALPPELPPGTRLLSHGFCTLPK